MTSTLINWEVVANFQMGTMAAQQECILLDTKFKEEQ